MRGDKTDRLICLFDVFVCVYEVGGLALSGKQSIKGINEMVWKSVHGSINVLPDP